MDDMKKRALAYLEKEALLHVDMTELIKRDICKLTYAEKDGVMLTYDKGESAMISCDSLSLAIKLLGDCPYDMLAIHQTEMKEAICARFGFENAQDCHQAAYTGKDPLPVGEADIRPLGSRWLDTICFHYKGGDREYIASLLEQSLMYGVFVEGELAGFVGRHSEGAIGLLQILPEYRRRGLAEKLNSFYINLELSKGHVPYGQIFAGNEASVRLNKKLGLEVADKMLCWLWKN